MARAKQKHLVPPDAALKVAVVLGALWLASKVAEAANPPVASGFLILVGLGVVLWFFDAKRRVTAATNKAVVKHLDTLVRIRAQTLRTDAYGNAQSDEWAKEIARFIDSQIAPDLPPPFYRKKLEKRRAAIAQQIEDRVAQAAANQPAQHTLPPNPTPVEFEIFCAEQLRQSGWDAQVTKGSGDQGVDVIATKNGVRVILQCKLYSKPVGNKAVQEAAAGRLHEGAHHAAVVSNSAYTPAAEQLARTTGVMLLHHSQLCELDKSLGIIRAERAS